MMQQNIASWCVITFFVLGLMASGCQNQASSPKPTGYPRINFPEEKSYHLYDTTCPFIFEIPQYAKVTPSQSSNKPCWLNIKYPRFDGNLHLTYRQFDDMEKLNKYREDARTFAYKHTVKASEIRESRINMDNINGIYYEIGGNTATALQFYVTDSSRHFLRASLYFNTEPNRDSLNPVIDYIGQDLKQMIRTLEWKNADPPNALE